MTCHAPPPLSDDEISAVLDGTAEEGVIQHVAFCPDCASRVADARRLEMALSRQLSRWDCPSPHALGEYHLRLLSDADARHIADHVAGCVRCQSDLAELAAFLADDAPRTEPDPSPVREWSRSRGRHLFPDTLLGTLLTRRPALALRGAGEEPVIIEAGGVTLFLKVEPDAGRPVLMGQLAGDDLTSWAGALVQLWQDGAIRATSEVDDLGTFRCEAFELHPFELRIAAPGGPTIVAPEINLTE